MICFDKLKIITQTKHIKRFDESIFTPVYKIKKFIGYKYQQKKPPELLILINYERDEVVIEFTSKISEYSFYNLINEDTISECLSSIAPFVAFEGYDEELLEKFEVLKCDVTKDVTCSDVKKLERYVKSNLANYDKWKCEKHPTGFVLKNVVGTPRYKKRIVIYDKCKELKLDKNREFLDNVDDYGEGDSYVFNDRFRDIIRFEMNINTKVQIREMLGIPDNRLMNVLNSDANPILTVLNEALKQQVESSCFNSSWKEYQNELVLKDCDYDLGKVEAKIKTLSKTTRIPAMMVRYRDLLQRLQSNKEPAFDLRKLVV